MEELNTTQNPYDRIIGVDPEAQPRLAKEVYNELEEQKMLHVIKVAREFGLETELNPRKQPIMVAEALIKLKALALTYDRLKWYIGLQDGTFAYLEASSERGGLGRSAVRQMYEAITKNKPKESEVKAVMQAIEEYQEYPPPTVWRLDTNNLNQEPLLDVLGIGKCRWGEFKALTPDEVFDTQTLYDSVGFMDINWDILDSDIPQAKAVKEHYGETWLRRPAYLLFGPKKTVDVIRAPLANAGKSTWAKWLKLALDSWVEVQTAAEGLNDRRFNKGRDDATRARIIVLDEADKLDKTPPPGVVNALTNDYIVVEKKGVDAVSLPRLGNTILLGADWPTIELGQGGAARVQWAENAPIMGELSPELRRWMLSPEGVKWYRAYLAKTSILMLKDNDDGSTEATIAAAKRFAEQAHSPIYQILAEIIEPGEVEDFVGNDDLKAAFEAHPDFASIGKYPDKRILNKEINSLAPKAYNAKSQQKRGVKGIKLIPT